MTETTVSTKLKPRDFESYLLEYQLLNTEIEINAYWRRMDEFIANLGDEEKSKFFAQMEEGLTKQIEDSKKMRVEIAASLPNGTKYEKLKEILKK